jgi:hypothetical protein
LCRAEVLYKSVADTQLYSQVPFSTGLLQTPG